MKQRITYIVSDPDTFRPELLDVKHASITLKKVQAAKERKVTIGLGELPEQLAKAFEQWHELHIRWASSKPYPSIPPFISRVTPGLHVFFTPHKAKPTNGQLCDLLHSTFGKELKCSSTSEAATKLPILSERFSMSASSQYYSYVPTLANLVNYVQEKVCGEKKRCKEEVGELLEADYLDVDYDAISHAVVLNAFWSTALDGDSWAETISVPGKGQSVEVGVLMHETRPDPEDIGFGGFLTVLGQDKAPKPTRFQTPTRHYPLSSTSTATSDAETSSLTYSTSFAPPTGLHPTLTLTFPTSPIPPNPTCKLHTHLTLPSYLILDKYQFTDSLFLASHNLKSLHSISGATDLEAPDWVVEQWGSAVLFELAVAEFVEGEDEGENEGKEWNATVPLHLRYLPAAESSHTSVPVPWPVVFWACRAEEGTKMSVNPFDRLHLGYEGLFGPKTRFMHVEPQGGQGKLVEWIDVPVLDLRKAKWVEVGTIGAVIVAFLGLVWVLFGGKSAAKKVESKGEGKKKQ
ncbi:PIG-X-domain-containing protein [Massarina eburnea CBS 473.64]|uniref:Protein PBN1 n=1 Tax=Massarina eburnea CBS 473.64 TaxID=1395130 RepID=A0A6A6RXV4_9PLEO|nr:PIG-X-domain-containing protein [Massarina eburnea CBS 473.64]